MLLAFTGGVPLRVSLDASYSVSDTQVSPTDATATWTVDSDGTLSSGGRWCNKTPPSGKYEVRATTISGTLTSGTTGSWTSLNTDQTWTVSRIVNIAGVNDWVGTIEIRDAVSLTVLDSTQLTLTAEVT